MAVLVAHDPWAPAPLPCSGTLLVATSAGSRVTVDLGQEAQEEFRLELQKVDQPEVSLMAASLRLGPVGLRSLFDRVGPLPHVIVLNMADCAVGDEGMRTLARALAQLPSMRSLYIQRTQISCVGVATLGAGLAETTAGPARRSLSLLSLAGNVGLGEVANSKLPADKQSRGLRALLATAAMADSGLTALDLGGCNLGIPGIAPLAELDMLPATKVTTLNLSYNRLGGGGSLVAVILTANQQLQNLDLGGNVLTSFGATVVLEAVKGAKGLRRLGLDRNSLGREGGLCAARLWLSLLESADHQPLTLLDIRHNHLTYPGVREICALLDVEGTPAKAERNGCVVRMDAH